MVTSYTSLPPSVRFVYPETTSEGTPFSSSRVKLTVLYHRCQHTCDSE